MYVILTDGESFIGNKINNLLVLYSGVTSGEAPLLNVN